MQITVINATVGQATAKSGKPYNFVELAYKGADGAVKGKKIMPFGEGKPVYDALAKAQNGEVYEIQAVKNESSGYWDWVGATKGAGTTSNVEGGNVTKPAGKVLGSTYETPEERAKKQVYIVRQSSITAALGFLGGKSKSVDEVVQIARQFEQYVFGLGDVQEEKVSEINELEDDVL